MIPQGLVLSRAALHPRKAVRSLAFGAARAQVNQFTNSKPVFWTGKNKARALRRGPCDLGL